MRQETHTSIPLRNKIGYLFSANLVFARESLRELFSPNQEIFDPETKRIFRYESGRGTEQALPKGEAAEPLDRLYKYRRTSLIDPQGIELIAYEERKHKGEPPSNFIEIVAIVDKGDNLNDSQAGVIVRYDSQGQRQILPGGIGDFLQREELLKRGHPLLSKLPEEISFFPTIMGFLKQAPRLDFSNPIIWVPPDPNHLYKKYRDR